MSKIIYLDYAAASPLDDQVLTTMQPYFSDKFYNPSATYLAAQAVREDLELARAKIGSITGVQPNGVIFTAGGTEANNLAINGIIEQFPGGNVIVSAIEHESVLKPAQQHDHQIVPVDHEGLIKLDKLEKMINDQTVLVSIIYANNEIGTVQHIRSITKIIKKKKAERAKNGENRPLYYHTDGCQAGAYLDLHLSGLGVDLLTLNGGKIYGPKQSGCLVMANHIPLKAQILGGGQENGRRSGTENVAGCVGLAMALELAQSRRTEEVKRMQSLQQEFFSRLQTKFPNVMINGALDYRLPNNVHITLPGQDNERLMMSLDEFGIVCAVGSACSASSDEPSHVLSAIGMSDQDARSSLRFSMGIHTNEADIKTVVGRLAEIVA